MKLFSLHCAFVWRENCLYIDRKFWENGFGSTLDGEEKTEYEFVLKWEGKRTIFNEFRVKLSTESGAPFTEIVINLSASLDPFSPSFLHTNIQYSTEKNGKTSRTKNHL